MPAGSWYPGAVWPGYHVETAPWVFAGPVSFQGTATVIGGPVTISGATTISGGIASSPPKVTSAGTVATGGTVTNSTGYDVMVYAAASTGISAAKIGTSVLPGTALNNQMQSYYLASGNAITLSYTGSLTWVWLAV